MNFKANDLNREVDNKTSNRVDSQGVNRPYLSAVDEIEANKELYVVHIEEKKVNQWVPTTSAFTSKPFEDIEKCWIDMRQYGINVYNKLSEFDPKLEYNIRENDDSNRLNAYVIILGWPKGKEEPISLKKSKYYFKLYMIKSRYYHKDQ